MKVTDDCVSCGSCISGIDHTGPVCPVKAISLSSSGAQIDKDKCISCGKCSKFCGIGAIVEG